MELAGLELTRHAHVDQLEADLAGRPFAVVLVAPAHHDAANWVTAAHARTSLSVLWLGGPETWPQDPRREPGVDVDVVFDPSRADEIRLAVRRTAASLTRESSSSRMFRSAATGIATSDLDGRVRQINAAYARMLGCSPESLLGTDLSEPTHPDDRARVRLVLDELRAGQRDHAVVEKRYLTHTGREVWCRVSFALERSAAGAPTGIVRVAEDVSDLKAAEAELTAALARERRARREADEASATYRHTAALLQMACRVVRMGAWWVDLGSEPVLTWSDETFEVFGLPPGRSMSVDEALTRYTPETRTAVAAALERCIETGEPYAVTGQLLRADGALVWTRSIGEAVRDATGRVTRVQGALLDITEEREAEASISESRRRFQQLADAMPFIVWSAAADGSVDFSNAAFFEYTGVPLDAPAKSRWQPCVHPDDVVVCLDTWAACVRDGVPYEIEYRLRRRDGEYRWFRVNAAPIREADGSIRVWYGTGLDVHENKRLERVASRTAGRLTATIESLTDAFVLVDGDWRFVHVNAGAERLLRKTREELLDADLWTHFRDTAGTVFEAHIRRAADERVAVDCDTPYEGLDRWLEVRAFPSESGLAIYVRDVTEQRRLDERLRESELRFRQLAKATNDAIWDWNLLTNELWWNEGFETLFGYDRAEIEPTIESWTRRVHPDEREAVVAAVDAAIAACAPGWSGEYRFGRKDGSYAFVFDRGHILYDSNGRAVRMIGGMTDLTEWKKAEETLAEQAELLDHAQDAIFVIDVENQITYWNSGAERLLGWTTVEVVGQRVDTGLRLDVETVRKCMDEASRDGGWGAELELTSRAGEVRTVASRWSVLQGKTGGTRGVLVIATDVTQRKLIEAQLMRAQRLESVGTLAGGIAHDLNNVLAPILTSVEMLRDGEQDAEKLEDLAVLEASATRGAEMVRQLLDFARGRTDDRREPTDLADVVSDVLRIAHETFPKNVSVRFLRGVSWAIQADPTQMHQLLMNLCVNARDAMPNGGLLTLAVESVVLDESYAGMNMDARPGPYVLIRVEDIGFGMSQEVQNRIFEPFFTTKEFGKGTGLGLSTCHAIVRNHGGFIHVYSEPHKGTRFKIYLPAEASRTSIDAVAQQISGLPRGDGELVLIVDDEEAIRRVTSRTLERYGYRSPANGAEAVSLYAQHQKEIAVVLTDMSMPIMDGPATIVALKSIDPDVLIIGSSGLDANGMLAKAMGAGVVDFLPKPYGAEALLQRIHRILQGRRSKT